MCLKRLRPLVRASDPTFSDPPGAFYLVASVPWVEAEVGDAVVPAPAPAPDSAADDCSAVESAVAAALRFVAQARRGACFAEAGSAAPGDLPAVAWPDDHSALAAQMSDSQVDLPEVD